MDDKGVTKVTAVTRGDGTEGWEEGKGEGGNGHTHTHQPKLVQEVLADLKNTIRDDRSTKSCNLLLKQRTLLSQWHICKYILLDS